MESLLHLDVTAIIQATGLFGVFAIVFAESGLFFGFFLPGDSLLFTAGFLASRGIFPIAFLMIGCVVAAIAGDSVGYAFGNRVGKRIFTREDSFFFRKKHLARAKDFYDTYGAKTIVISRFVPVVRSFAPIVAGAVDMEYRTFLFYNVIGGGLWALGLTALGYGLGSLIANVDRYLLPFIGVIIFLSCVPPVIHVLMERRRNGHS